MLQHWVQALLDVLVVLVNVFDNNFEMEPLLLHPLGLLLPLLLVTCRRVLHLLLELLCMFPQVLKVEKQHIRVKLGCLVHETDALDIAYDVLEAFT